MYVQGLPYSNLSTRSSKLAIDLPLFLSIQELDRCVKKLMMALPNNNLQNHTTKFTDNYELKEELGKWVPCTIGVLVCVVCQFNGPILFIGAFTIENEWVNGSYCGFVYRVTQAHSPFITRRTWVSFAIHWRYSRISSTVHLCHAMRFWEKNKFWSGKLISRRRAKILNLNGCGRSHVVRLVCV